MGIVLFRFTSLTTQRKERLKRESNSFFFFFASG